MDKPGDELRMKFREMFSLSLLVGPFLCFELGERVCLG